TERLEPRDLRIASSAIVVPCSRERLDVSRLPCAQMRRANFMCWDASQVHRVHSTLKRCPHFPVALSGPDLRPVDAACLVIGARYTERQTMFVDRKILELRVQS